ncbi:predicted protein [Nematostella vectensis]|uniref:Mannosyl-oligosaccharide glucosidase n=1 Tax=Nematostella vectensis TaxID=45351 RepID=A7S8Y7_NEMVE|nr:predicted protein [Nematostella vectensis]|eukprot:XP_001631876.1 predicted protein [Nematostella vectensis]
MLIAVPACIFATYAVWNYRRAARLCTPLDAPKVIDSSKADARRFWGTYRSNLYFGLRTRSPKSLMLGLMWFSQFPHDGQLSIRHTCEQGDGLPKYGWLKHDGVKFGVQEIVDQDFILTTDFAKRFGGKHGGDWTARITGRKREGGNPNQVVSLIFYTTHENSLPMEPKIHKRTLTVLHGESPELGKFSIHFPRPSKNVKLSNFLATHTPNVHSVKDIVMQSLQYVKLGKKKQLIGLSGFVGKHDENNNELPTNLYAQQWTLELPFEMEIVFESESFATRADMLEGEVFTDTLNKYKEAFDAKFEEKFPLKAKGFDHSQKGFAQAAFSNMLGGIGYFYGSSRVVSRYLKEPVDYWEAPLYTAVPSRPFFPRGFLWDEGFHQLLISHWDTSISTDIIGHWLDLMNAEGWIPREQILGDEARTKVPAEFITQHNENANPPTLILPIKAMIDKGVLDRDYLSKIYPRLKTWFSWFNNTQTGSLPSTYRWHGRDGKSDRELNPKTLTSGLDDYPRASHPSEIERHVDLRCWMAFAAGLMADIAEAVGQNSDPYKQTSAYLSDVKLLDKYHWSVRQQMYSDFGNHTKFVKLVHRSTQPGGPTRMVRIVTSRTGPTSRFVNSFGYVSLFPFLLQILKPDSPRLETILKGLRDPDKLWTDYGLRSLSRTDPLYMKYNTEHDGPYWRGSIWININFLSVRALHFYGNTPGPYRSFAKEIYGELRRNLIGNIYRQYVTSGFVWEQYDDGTGRGKGTHPFTGWSSLVVLMMAEQY